MRVLEIPYSEDLLIVSGQEPQELEQELRFLLASKLFELRRPLGPRPPSTSPSGRRGTCYPRVSAIFAEGENVDVQIALELPEALRSSHGMMGHEAPWRQSP